MESLKKKQYTPQDMRGAPEEPMWVVNDKGEPDKTWRGHAKSAVKYIRSLAKLRVFGALSTQIDRPPIVDLPGLKDKAMSYIASRILDGANESVASESYEYPTPIIVEEAHKFIHPKRETYAFPIIDKIAAEGRKFGVFLTLITQRPSKVDPARREPSTGEFR